MCPRLGATTRRQDEAGDLEGKTHAAHARDAQAAIRTVRCFAPVPRRRRHVRSAPDARRMGHEGRAARRGTVSCRAGLSRRPELRRRGQGTPGRGRLRGAQPARAAGRQHRSDRRTRSVRRAASPRGDDPGHGQGVRRRRAAPAHRPARSSHRPSGVLSSGAAADVRADRRADSRARAAAPAQLLGRPRGPLPHPPPLVRLRPDAAAHRRPAAHHHGPRGRQGRLEPHAGAPSRQAHRTGARRRRDHLVLHVLAPALRRVGERRDTARAASGGRRPGSDHDARHGRLLGVLQPHRSPHRQSQRGSGRLQRGAGRREAEDVVRRRSLASRRAQGRRRGPAFVPGAGRSLQSPRGYVGGRTLLTPLGGDRRRPRRHVARQGPGAAVALSSAPGGAGPSGRPGFAPQRGDRRRSEGRAVRHRDAGAARAERESDVVAGLLSQPHRAHADLRGGAARQDRPTDLPSRVLRARLLLLGA